MDFRFLITGLAVLPLVLIALVGTHAAQRTTEDRYFADKADTSVEFRSIDGLPGVFPDAGTVIQTAQISDPQIRQLQEEIRALNGRIEELSFQLLQLQEQIRRMQEDNEFRFQELEQKRSDAGDTGTKRAQARSKDPPEKAPDEVGKTIAGAVKSLGSIRFDADGNVVGGTIAGDLPELPADDPGTDDTIVAALPDTDDPEELYGDAYQFILSGDYRTAQAGFQAYIERFPDTPQSADAHYWLGEALLGQQKYREAAEVFRNANRKYVDARRGPDMLLKLGVSMAALNQRDAACATFVELGQRYPTVSPALQDRLTREMASAGC